MRSNLSVGVQLKVTAELVVFLEARPPLDMP